jgi:cell division protease FtsH
MAEAFPWLPIGVSVAPGITIGRVVDDRPDHQLIRAREGEFLILLIAANTPLAMACTSTTDNVGKVVFHPLAFGDNSYMAGVFAEDDAPIHVGNMPQRPGSVTSNEAALLAAALADLARREPLARWETALFFPALGRCIATESTKGEDRRTLAIRLLTSGIADASLSPTQVRAINQWLTLDDIERFMNRLGLVADRPAKDSKDDRGAPAMATEFALPGRPELEKLFREYVIDYFRDRERYQAMGVKPPGGILLHGPPGSGKSFAAKKLAEYLGWSIFEIDIGRVGSPYIHQTSVQLRRTFDAAAAKTPALVILDEFDALASERSGAFHDHKIEEVAEMLRLIEAASERGILVVATTNRKDAIDPAMLRRGRFDHVVEVGYPTADDVRAALETLLAERPHAASLNLDKAAEKLQNRPMSDIGWVVNEAARLAVKANKNEIDDICLFRAVSKLS